MGTSILKLCAPWEEVKEKIKEINIELTDEDLEYEEGNPDILLERLAIKLKRSKEQVKAFIESISYTDGIAG
jgi:hypothetical protein